MNNFDKALDAAAHKHEHELDVIGWDPDVIFGAKNGFELGAHWSRQFTIAEYERLQQRYDEAISLIDQMRGQWIHSVHKEQCLYFLKKVGAE